MVTESSSLTSAWSSSASGASFTSVTVIVTSMVSEALELSLALTVTVWDGANSWSSDPSSFTRIWPLAPSIVKRSDVGSSSYRTVSPLSMSVAVTRAPTAAFAWAFSATLRVVVSLANSGGLLTAGFARTVLDDTTTRLLPAACPSS